jgi:hypothetical protein
LNLDGTAAFSESSGANCPILRPPATYRAILHPF